MSGPRFTVVVPAHQAEALLPITLGALAQSDLPRAQWELLVVDDGSRDGTASVASPFADRVLSLPPPNRGPAFARNAGAAEARGEWLVFVDADVRVHPDTLARIAARIDAEPDIVALFGTYDATPEARGWVSEYRNLLHRRVHSLSPGDAETFWAGLGAVRKDAFDAAGGFDVQRYPRPQIEDIELGYRLRDRQGRIVNDPSVEATHLKRWTLWSMVRTDVFDRGIPWMRLLLERRDRPRTLNTVPQEQLKVVLAALAMVCAAAALLDVRWLLASASLLTALAVSNHATSRWFASQRGVGFAAAALPLHLLHYLSSAVAAAAGVALHLLSRAGGRRKATT